MRRYVRIKPFIVLLTACAALVLLTGCREDMDVARVDFSRQAALEKPREKANEHTLTVAVSAMVSPDETFTYYRQMLNYLGNGLGVDVQLIQRKTYAEINELLGMGKIDLAFVCSGPYASARERFGFEALAVPQVRQQTVYRSYLIVNKHSSIEKLAQLRNRVFAFTDPDSNTGCLFPSWLLMRMGETPESFFAKTIFTYSHDNSMLAVSRNLVDGAFVHEQIWEYYQKRNPRHTAQTRVIFKSEPFGNPPLIAGAGLDPAIKNRVRKLLLQMHSDPKGRAILGELLIDRFLPVDEGLYEPIRIMYAQLQLGKQKHVSAQKP